MVESDIDVRKLPLVLVIDDSQPIVALDYSVRLRHLFKREHATLTNSTSCLGVHRDP